MFISNWWQVLITTKSCPVSVQSLPGLSLQAASPCEDNQTINLAFGFDGKNGFFLRCFLQILQRNLPFFSPLHSLRLPHSLDRPPCGSYTSTCACTLRAARGPICQPCDCPSFFCHHAAFFLHGACAPSRALPPSSSLLMGTSCLPGFCTASMGTRYVTVTLLCYQLNIVLFFFSISQSD